MVGGVLVLADLQALRSVIQELHFRIYRAVRSSIRTSSITNPRGAKAGAGDISYAIDVIAEEIISEFFSQRTIGNGVIVVSEGIGRRVFPEGLPEDMADYVLIIDPIDGTREIMYNKRSAWILTGVARNRGAVTLADIEFAIQTEIPTLKQDRASVVYASAGQGSYEEVWDIENGRLLTQPARLSSSSAVDLRHGFIMFVDPYTSARSKNAAVVDQLIEQTVGPARDDEALVFTDQYGSTAGQVYMLATAKYRLVADLRPAIASYQRAAGKGGGLCCHPYDLCTCLVAVEAGCAISGLTGGSLQYPLDTDTDCGWIGYANPSLRAAVEPALLPAVAGAFDQTAQTSADEIV